LRTIPSPALFRADFLSVLCLLAAEGIRSLKANPARWREFPDAGGRCDFGRESAGMGRAAARVTA